MSGISVVICCYNSAERIRATLEALSRCAADFPVEVMLVDNKSTDGTAEVAAAAWHETGNDRFRFSVVPEERPGLSFARKRGLDEAHQDIVVYCDDDNWLEPDYLIVAMEIMRAHPTVGVLGGQSIAAYECEPPAWFVRNARWFAIGTQGEQEGNVTERRGWMWGAGAVFRADALHELEMTGIEPVVTDRQGGRMTTGGDVELCYYLRELGWRIWYSPRLVLRHYMPRSRFDPRKFRELVFQNGVFDAHVRYPLADKGGRAKAAARWMKQFLRRRRRLGWSPAGVMYLAGQLYGLVTGGKAIAAVRANKRRLVAQRLQGVPAGIVDQKARDTGLKENVSC